MVNITFHFFSFWSRDCYYFWQNRKMLTKRNQLLLIISKRVMKEGNQK